MNAPLLEKMQELLAGLCERALSPAQKARLEELVCTDEACCEYYVKVMHVEAALPRFAGAAVRSAAAVVAEWQARQGSNQDAVLRAWAQCDLGNVAAESAADTHGDQTTISAPSAAHAVVDRQNASGSTADTSDRRPILISLHNILRRGAGAMPRAAAALLIASMCGGLVAMAATVAVMNSNFRYAEPKYVAQLTAAHELQWADDSASPMVDQLLAEGQTLEVIGGWAEITFKNGVRTVLEGPAKLELRSSESARLDAGKLVVELPHRSHSFAVNAAKFSVDTPTSRVVDSGAEFGIQVDRQANTQIEVFEGLINVHPLANDGKALAGLPEWLSAGESIRVAEDREANSSQPSIERSARSEMQFVRTLRAKSHLLGSTCIGRPLQDTAKGVVIMLRDPATKTGRAANVSFYNVHGDNDRWITPIILAFDRTTGVYRVTGIGQSVLNLGSGLQTVPFQLIAGSADLQAGVHTFGFYHGTVDKTGKATKPSLGPLDFDNAPESNDALNPLAAEARWLFVPAVQKHNPVELRLDLEFSLEPTSGQTQLWQGDDKHSKERVYSGQLEIVAQPQFPATAVKSPATATQSGNGSSRP
jgi:hypothetical protein